MGRILVVQDDPDMSRVLASTLRRDNHQITEAHTVRDAFHNLTEDKYDVVFTVTRLTDGTGLDVLARGLTVDPAVAVVFLGYGVEFDSVAETLDRGAFDFLSTTYNTEIVRSTARHAILHTEALRENRRQKNLINELERRLHTVSATGGLSHLGGHAVSSASGAAVGPVRLPVTALPAEEARHPSEMVTAGGYLDLSAFLDQTEKDLILGALGAAHGVQAEAARHLGLSRSALAYKLTKYGIRTTQEKAS